MRVTWLVFLLACGSPKPTPASPDRLAAACRDLDSPDLAVRVAGTRQLEPEVGRVEGGTEQQMDASRAYCARRFGAPAPAEPTSVGACFDACYAQRLKAGESKDMAEGDCMQNCNSGE